MADTARKTRRKPALGIAAPKPRNPLVVLAARRAAGSHRKSTSALRAAENQALKRKIERDADDGPASD